jgi:amidase
MSGLLTAVPDGLREQATAVAEGRVTSVELVETALERAETAQATLRPFRVIMHEAARRDALEADIRRARGEQLPLLGVPVAVKDDVDVAGETTPFGCAGHWPAATSDSEVVARLRRAGAVIVGKTMTCEIGQWPFSESSAFGAARNPWDPARTPGGSSGGAAAAVAAGVVPAAIGSDGAGSVRIPAAWCGLVGVTPGRGLVPTTPETDPFCGLTVYGPLARTVGDAGLALDVVAGTGRRFAEAAKRSPGRLRVALSFRVPLGVRSRCISEISVSLRSVAHALEGLGHAVVEADPDYGLVGPALVPRGSAGVAAWADRVPPGTRLERRTRTALRTGRAMSGAPRRWAHWMEPRLRDRIGRIFDRADVVLTPTTAGMAPKVAALDGAGWWRTSTAAAALCPYAFAWNVIGWPAISVPAGLSPEGLPIGAQLLGREGDEGTLLALAAQLEQVERWADRRPAL